MHEQLMTDGPIAPSHGHVLSLYESENERQSCLAHWVRTGLDRGEKIVYPLVPGMRWTESLLWTLAAHGVDANAAVNDRRLEELPLPQFYTLAGTRSLVDAALAEGHSGVRLAGESHFALKVMSRTALSGYEQAIDHLCEAQPLSVLCQYPKPSADSARLGSAIRAHGGGTWAGHLYTAGDGHGLTFAGPLDDSNEDLLTTALRALTETSSPAVQVDLTHADSVDAAGCRALAEGTQRFREGGGLIRLVSARPEVAQALRGNGVDHLLNMQVREIL